MSPKTTTISYQMVNTRLHTVDASTDAAEAHGILCGLICVDSSKALNAWLSHVLGDQDPRDATVQQTQRLLMDLRDKTSHEFTSGDFDLDLLLLDDEAPLSNRIECLSEWCQGFMFGLNIAGMMDLTKLSPEAQEISQDITEFAKAAYDQDEDQEVSEHSYTEIIEYIRIGALVIYEDLNHNDPAPSPLLH